MQLKALSELHIFDPHKIFNDEKQSPFLVEDKKKDVLHIRNELNREFVAHKSKKAYRRRICRRVCVKRKRFIFKKRDNLRKR